MIKRFFLPVAAVLVVAALVAPLGAQAPRKKLTLAMAVTPPNLVHIPPYLAKDLGYFKEEGLDVDIISFEGGVGSLRVLLAGQVDLALTSGDIYRYRSQTLDAAAEITGYSREELEPAFDQLIKGRVWSVNEGLQERMVHFNIENQVRVGNIPADKKPTYDFVADLGPATAAVKALGKWTDDPGRL